MRKLAAQTLTNLSQCLPHALVLSAMAHVLPSALPARVQAQRRSGATAITPTSVRV
jgi:hypothetical protein